MATVKVLRVAGSSESGELQGEGKDGHHHTLDRWVCYQFGIWGEYVNH